MIVNNDWHLVGDSFTKKDPAEAGSCAMRMWRYEHFLPCAGAGCRTLDENAEAKHQVNAADSGEHQHHGEANLGVIHKGDGVTVLAGDTR